MTDGSQIDRPHVRVVSDVRGVVKNEEHYIPLIYSPLSSNQYHHLQRGVGNGVQARD